MIKQILIILSVLLVLVVIYFNLPFELTRKSDIEFGNKLVKEIIEYQKEYKELPETGSWEILKQLGFKVEMVGTNPSYEKINEDEFELIYFEGFDGPYLFFNSKQKNWKIDFPSIPASLEEKGVLE